MSTRVSALILIMTARSALTPITPEGCWLPIWFGTVYGRNINIEHNLFRFDLVPVGGCIEVNVVKGQAYHHLQFYLWTKLHVSDPRAINYWHHDLKALLKLFCIVHRSPDSDDEIDLAEELSSDAMDWEEDMMEMRMKRRRRLRLNKEGCEEIREAG